MSADGTFTQKKSFLSWVGGKSRLTKHIVPLIPEHHTYVEVFAGAAWLLFRKPPSAVEIINDINLELVTLYRVVQSHLEEFVRCLKWLLVAREQFAVFMASNPSTLTDIQRAVRFYYMVRTGFGSKVDKPSFSVSPTRPSNFNLLRIEHDLSEAHLRLSRVYVENKPYQDLITRHDRPETFFYIDPPYYGCEDYYGKLIFDRSDFAKLASLLATVKGKFIVSLNDTPEVRDVFKAFHIRTVQTHYSLARTTGKTAKEVRELLILNYTPAR